VFVNFIILDNNFAYKQTILILLRCAAIFNEIFNEIQSS